MLAENRPSYNISLYLEDLSDSFEESSKRVCGRRQRRHQRAAVLETLARLAVRSRQQYVKLKSRTG